MPAFRFEALVMLAAGLSFAGVMAEAFHLLFGRRISFTLLIAHGRRGWLAAPLLFATGPIVLLRNNYRAFVRSERPLRFIVVGTAIAVGWSLLTGALLLKLALWFAG